MRTQSIVYLLMLTAAVAVTAHAADERPAHFDKVTIPFIDLNDETHRQVVVDREDGQYLGHPSTLLLEDGKTILCVYPKGHGVGAIVYKRSTDGGLTWSDRLPTPKSWADSKEVPVLARVVDAQGKKRIIMWAALYPAMMAVSEDDGKTWSELKQMGDWGGVVVVGDVMAVKTGAGHYMAMFHDDGRYIRGGPGKSRGDVPTGKRENPVRFTLYQINSTDGGLTWTEPLAIQNSTAVHLCEPGFVRSPDGKQIAVLLRENARRKNAHIIFSNDEGKTWSEPRELPLALSGDRHQAEYTSDGRLFISYRMNPPRGKKTPTNGSWAAWVGTYHDLVHGREGQYLVRLKKNHKGADCAYPGVEVLPDNTIVATTYGHWTPKAKPYILSVRLKLAELDAKVKTK